jgi:N utilization substance protein B
MTNQKIAKQTTNAKKSSARLYAVQAVYQMRANEQNAKEVSDEFIEHRLGQSMDELAGLETNGTIFKKIVLGVEEKLSDLENILHHARGDKIEDIKKNDALLYSILLCGVYEVLTQGDIEPAIIISDYLNVTHSFYDGGESKLINAILDKVNVVIKQEKV